LKCAKCHKEIQGREVKIGESKETMRTVCLGCRTVWVNIYEKKVKLIEDRQLQQKVWVEEYHKFIGIINKEKVSFT
jgi:hypothetical protein